MEELSHVKRAAGLLRISTDKTDATGKKVNLEETLRNHEEKITAYCEENRWEYDLYKEVISGGTEYDDRIELKALLNNLEQYQVIVVMELQRLSRQGEVSQKIKTKVIKQGTLIVTLNPFQIYDMANNSMDALMYDIGAALAEYERRVASQRVKANKISMSRQGLNSSGSVAFGYTRDPITKKLDIEKDEDGNETEAPKIVRQIYKWFLEGHGQKKISEMLNDLGYKNKQGNRWVVQSIRYMLECPTYKGTLVANSFSNKHGKVTATETVVIDEAFPAIIDPEIWEKVQQLKSNKKERYYKTNSRERTDKKHKSILDDLVFCECCGRKTTIKFVKERNAFYIRACEQNNADGKVCNNGGFKLERFEAAVFKEILSYQKQVEEKMIKYKSNDFESSIKEMEEQRNQYEKALETLLIKMKVIRKLEKDYEMEKEISGYEDIAEEEEIRQDKKENQQQRLAIQNKLEEINTKLSSAPVPEKEIRKLNEKIEIVEALKKKPNLTIEEINCLLKQFILKIRYKRILPSEIAALGNKNPLRDNYPAELEIEYIQ